MSLFFKLLPLRLNMEQSDDKTFSIQDYQFAFVIGVAIYVTLVAYMIYRGGMFSIASLTTFIMYFLYIYVQ